MSRKKNRKKFRKNKKYFFFYFNRKKRIVFGLRDSRARTRVVVVCFPCCFAAAAAVCVFLFGLSSSLSLLSLSRKSPSTRVYRREKWKRQTDEVMRTGMSTTEEREPRLPTAFGTPLYVVRVAQTTLNCKKLPNWNIPDTRDGRQDETTSLRRPRRRPIVPLVFSLNPTNESHTSKKSKDGEIERERRKWKVPMRRHSRRDSQRFHFTVSILLSRLNFIWVDVVDDVESLATYYSNDPLRCGRKIPLDLAAHKSVTGTRQRFNWSYSTTRLDLVCLSRVFSVDDFRPNYRRRWLHSPPYPNDQLDITATSHLKSFVRLHQPRP